jgi:hypothetical protein
VENQTFNPFNQHIEEKNKQKREMGGERVRVKAKFMAHFRDEKEE